MKYGYCLNHPNKVARNSKRLCDTCTKERHERAAASKGIITKSAKSKIEEDEFDNTRGRTTKLRSIQNADAFDGGQQGEICQTQKAASKKTKINPRSEKNKAIVAQELLMFKQIWEERPHFCEVSGKPIRFFHPACFSHVLAKGAYPKFRLYKKNIVLCLYEWHHKWEFETRKIPELSWIETLESALKTEYYNGKQRRL